MASSVSPIQDTTAFLSVLYWAIECYGPPEVLDTDGGVIFRSHQAQAI